MINNCASCGDSEIKLQRERWFNTVHMRYYCDQKACGARHNFSLAPTDEEAQEKALVVWNRRTE